MPTPTTLPVCTVQLALNSQLSITLPLLLPNVLALNTPQQQLAKELIDILEEKAFKQGEQLAVLRYAPQLNSLQKANLQISLKRPRKQTPVQPDVVISFEYLYTELPNQQLIGFIPAIGIEAHGRDPDKLENNLQQAVELEFARHKRLNDVRRLISAQWFQDLRYQHHRIDTKLYSPQETENRSKQEQQPWLPRMASPLKVDETCCCFGRDNELRQIIQNLSGKYRRSILLVAPAGVGKSAVVEEFCRIRDQHGLGDVTLWETTAARTLQRLTAESGWEDSFAQALTELGKRDDILYIRNLAQLFEVGAYAGNNISLADFLRDYLNRGSVQVISECTDSELAKIDLRAPGYSQLFQVIRLKELPEKQRVDILRRRLAATHPQATINDAAFDETLRLLQRYALYSGFPGKAVRFLENLLTENDIQNIERADVVQRFCRESGMPARLVDSQTALDLKQTQAFFQQRLFGQDAAIEIVVDLLAAVKTRLTRAGKPITSLLFVGPTGVGKTELAKALATFMFGDAQRLLRFDMSEYADDVAVLRLTGDVQRGGQGLLTGAVRQQPFSVILFDELEKASSSFYDLLLQILGEGRLTDAKGQLADFCSSVIIMTSNIGAGESRQRSPGFHGDLANAKALQQHYMRSVQQFFRPELFNRLDQVIPFNALSLDVLRPIVEREVKKLLQREGIRSRPVDVNVSPEAIDWIALNSGEQRYGARQLQRTLQRQLAVPLAQILNQHSDERALWIKVLRALEDSNEPLQLQVMVQDYKPLPDQVLADSQFTLREWDQQIAAQRRRFKRFLDGAVINRLWSQWDILDRQRRRSGKAFWQDHVQAKQYTYLQELLEEGKQLGSDIAALETQSNLLLMGLVSLDDKSPHIGEHLLDWYGKSQNWLLVLLEYMEPESAVCTLGVYGDEMQLPKLVKLLASLARRHNRNWEVRRWKVLWDYTESQYQTIADDKPLSQQQRELPIIGMELEVRGLGAGWYFANEGGQHLWKDGEQGEWTYAVIAENLPWADYDTPSDIHRIHVVELLEKCRVYTPTGYTDLTQKNRQIYNGEDWREQLDSLLMDRLLERLELWLLDEATEQ